MKRIFYTVTAIILLLLNLPTFNVSAIETSGDYIYIVKDETAMIVGYTGAGGNVEIPDTIDGYPVARIGIAFWNKTEVTSITIPESAISIEEGAFSRCANLTSVTIPNSVTFIGEEAFSQCTALRAITIPESVKEIGMRAFQGCTSLMSVDILNETIGASMYLGCSALTTLNLNENVTDIGLNAFGGCRSLQSVTIPESVKNIDYAAFSGCVNLTNVVFNNPNTEFKGIPSEEGYPIIPLAPTFSNNNSLSTIYAYTGSKAQGYALNQQLNFVAIAGVQLNGQKLKFDMPPIIENGRVLVPMRAIFETFGAEIDWDGETSTVTATTSDKYITMQIGNRQMQLNGEIMTLDVPPQIIFDRTLVPVRAVSESLGATVDWDEEDQTVIINTQ